MLFRTIQVGTHVFNSGTVKYFGAKNLANNNYMSHGPYHYVNVPRGKVCVDIYIWYIGVFQLYLMVPL